MTSVAICQPKIILGGRLRVIIAIIDVLNQLGLEPDILTGNLAFSPEKIQDFYGRNVKFKLKILPYPELPKVSPDFSYLWFNALLRYYANEYDLLINTSNSLVFLPPRNQVLSYVFFPRKQRLTRKNTNEHIPSSNSSNNPTLGIQMNLLRTIYRFAKPNSKHRLICMTIFTRDKLLNAYELAGEIPVIYPPVEMELYRSESGSRSISLVTMGRFAPAKGQLEQIKLAQKMPWIEIHIIGFAGNNSYYQLCCQYINENVVPNVHLHPDAPLMEVVSLLGQSKYFLHTLVDEPFGLTAVQAIAAGCLPLVHDSGGQRETVPIERLRYKSLDDIPRLIRSLERINAEEVSLLVKRLQDNAVLNFDASVFHKKISCVIEDII